MHGGLYMKSIIDIEPRYQETDQMGVIHHSVYPIWYEMGRIQFCKDIGYPFDEIEKQNIGLAMVSLTCNYIKPTYFGKKYQMITTLLEFSRVKMIFEYRIYDEEKHLVHQGTTKLSWLSDDFKPLDIKRRNISIYESFIKAIEK